MIGRMRCGVLLLLVTGVMTGCVKEKLENKISVNSTANSWYSNPFDGMSKAGICKFAVNERVLVRRWETNTSLLAYVDEAKKRLYTPDQCATVIGLGATDRVLTQKPKETILWGAETGELIFLDPADYQQQDPLGKIRQANTAKIRSMEGNMITMPGGSFWMGSFSGSSNQKPARSVGIWTFELGQFEVTQAQWRAVMGSSPSHFKNCDNCPVENVSWEGTQAFIQQLNQVTNGNFRLPSEAEWEYACLGASKKEALCGGNDARSLAWYSQNSVSRTHRVGRLKPNSFGLYDMSGNVMEWVEDCYQDTYMGAPSTGVARTTDGCDNRVLRGGSWRDSLVFLGPSFRGHGWGAKNYTGFRLARDL